MSYHMQKCNFIHQLVCEILQFKESIIIFFPDIWLLWKVGESLILPYSNKKVYTNGLDFCQNPKNLIFGAFLGLFGPAWPARIFFFFFFQKSGFATFLTLWLFNIMQKISRKLMNQLWDLPFLTEGQTDEQSQIHRTLSLVRKYIGGIYFYMRNSGFNIISFVVYIN